MKLAIFIISVLVILIILEFAFVQNPIDLTDYFEESGSCEFMTNMDIDLDGYEEVATFSRTRDNIVFRCRGGWTSYRLENIKLADFSDILAAAGLEAIINCEDDSGHTFYILTDICRQPTLADSIRFVNGKDIDNKWGWDGTYTFIGSHDITRDNFPDLFFFVNAGWDKKPRSVFAYDIQRKERIWTYDIVNPPIAYLDDLYGDENPEVVVYGSAPRNDVKKGMMEDDRVRVTVLDIMEGKQKWIREFDPPSYDVRVRSVPSIGSKRARLCVATTYRGKEWQTRIYMLDALNGRITDSLSTCGQITELYSYRFSNMIGAEIALEFMDNTLQIYNDTLGLVNEKRYKEHIFLSGVDDINLDGMPEYFVTTIGTEAFILDSNLDRIASYSNILLAGYQPKFVFSKDEQGKPTRIFLTGEVASKPSPSFEFSVPNFPKYSEFNKYIRRISRNKRTIQLIIIMVSLISLIVVREFQNRKFHSFYKTTIYNKSFAAVHIKNNMIIAVNKKAQLLLDIDIDNERKQPIASIFRQEGYEDLRTRLEETRQTWKIQSFDISMGSGSKREEFEAEVIPVTAKKGKLMEYILTFKRLDISKKEWFELAKGIAHDIKNPSGLASTQLSSIASELRSGSDLNRAHLINRIEEASVNVKRSLDRVSIFAGIVKDLEITPMKTDVNSFLEDYTAIRRLSVPKQIYLKFEPGLSIPEVLLDRRYFETVLDNLLYNSIDALSSKETGNITISTNVASVPFKAKYGERLISSVCISLSDTGIGISKENLQKIFNLDFSTKEGKGLGMGLHQVRKIIEVHGGRIEVDSYEGEGTTFKIYIPIEQA